MSDASPARERALEICREVRLRDAFVHEVADKVLEESSLSAEEASFARLLAYGTVATIPVLDELIDRNLNSPRDVKADVRDALRISAYEMLFLDKPSFAVVSQGVELVRSFRPRAAGLANAVLRKMNADAVEFPWGDPEADLAVCARKHGYPLWMAESLAEDRGEKFARAFMTATDEPAPVYVATLPFAGDEDKVLEELFALDGEAEPFGVPGCVKLSNPSAVLQSDLVRDNRIVVADATGQLIAHLAAPESGSTFLEIAAGRGTKTLLMQGSLVRAGKDPATIHTVDLHEFKVNILAVRMHNIGVPRIAPHAGDATNLDDVFGIPPQVDAAFIDAPCTGLGTLRRHPEQRVRIQKDDAESLADVGLAMLEETARHVRVGGTIVYATCTMTYWEDESVILRFTGGEMGSSWALDPFTREELDALGCPWATLSSWGFLLNLPQFGQPDGFFAARLRRVK